MNIGAVPNHAFPTVGFAISASHQSGRMSLPVSPSSYIYAHFRHVSGVPAPEGVSGVNISKLKILDTLIEQLRQMKKQPEPVMFSADQGDDARMGGLIEQYQSQIRTIQAANAGNPYAMAAPPVGAVFSVNV